MTPKEKAKDLVNRLKPHSYNGAVEENDELMELYHAKQCALIAVDEIMIQCWNYRDIDLETSYNYWQQVKQEIELL